MFKVIHNDLYKPVVKIFDSNAKNLNNSQYGIEKFD